MRDDKTISYLKERYISKFGKEPGYLFSSPGRIELLGNHTDHNHGKVLVSSINLKVLAVVGERDDDKVVVFSKGYKKIEININDLDIREEEFGKSIGIVRGTLAKFKELGYKIGGFNVICASSIYSGAGVSSSAAFEVLFGKILSVLFNDNKVKQLELAKIAQFTEMVYFNKPCGLLDQAGIAFGGVNYIDFRSLKNPRIKHLNLTNDNYIFIIINTGDSHSTLTENYAEIKSDMKEIANHYGVEVLRDVDAKDFFRDKKLLISKYGERKVLRAKHFFEENKRVSTALNCLIKDDFEGFLKMLDESGKSSYYQLKNCYVENEEEKLPMALKYVKELVPECYSRVHGGGFAGTILMVIKKEKSRSIISNLKAHFGPENVTIVSLTKFGTSLLKK